MWCYFTSSWVPILIRKEGVKGHKLVEYEAQSRVSPLLLLHGDPLENNSLVVFNLFHKTQTRPSACSRTSSETCCWVVQGASWSGAEGKKHRAYSNAPDPPIFRQVPGIWE